MIINPFVPNTDIFNNIGNSNTTKSTSTSSKDFLSVLKENLDQVNEQQVKANDLTSGFIAGDGTDIQDVMISTEEAKTSLELAVQMRNKLVDAYQELSKTQV